jgi:hypothetical protein
MICSFLTQSDIVMYDNFMYTVVKCMDRYVKVQQKQQLLAEAPILVLFGVQFLINVDLSRWNNAPMKSNFRSSSLDCTPAKEKSIDSP